MYVCRIYDDEESELVLALHRIKSLSWKSKLPDISHILWSDPTCSHYWNINFPS